MSWRGVRVLGLGFAALLALTASTHDGGGDGDEPQPPGVSIDEPDSGPVLVHAASFEIGGRFSGQVNTIEISIDGTSQGEALRAEPGRWRLPAARFALAPGLHDFEATATGERGTDTDEIQVFYQPDPSITFEIVLLPAEATYAPEEQAADPRLLTFGPGFGEDFAVELTVDVAPQLTATTNRSIGTGTQADLLVDIVDPVPGIYTIVVRGTGDNGEVREATHTVTITGPPPTTEAPEETPTGDGAEPTAVLFDDFEGPDRWTATMTRSTNGSEATVELAGGGNPGSHRRMAHVLPGTTDGEANPSQITVLHIFTGGSWDPATAGALSRLNYSEDQIELEPPFEGAAIGTSFVIVQGGTTYTASINEGNAYTNTAWGTVRVDGLTPADFEPAPGPDFSASGAPMTFGYQRGNTSRSTAGITTQHGIDNWTVELFGE